MTSAEWNTLLDAVRILFPIAGTAVGGWVVALLRQILATMKDFNDRIIALERDHLAHRELDDTRFESMQREIDQQRSRLGLVTQHRRQ